MGLAAPGFVKHQLSMHLSSESMPARPHYWHQSSHIQNLSPRTFLSFQCWESESLWKIWCRTWPIVLTTNDLKRKRLQKFQHHWCVYVNNVFIQGDNKYHHYCHHHSGNNETIVLCNFSHIILYWVGCCHLWYYITWGTYRYLILFACFHDAH